MDIVKISSGNSNKIENDTVPISSSARSASMKIKHSNSQRHPKNSYYNGGAGSFTNPNNNSHSRRHSILLLSESVQSRKSGINMGTRNSRNSTSSTTLQNLASKNMAGSYGKSIDSKVFININSPNFKSENQDEILNSLSQHNYLNFQHRRKSNHSHAASHVSSSDVALSNSSVAVGDEDDEDVENRSESPSLNEHDPHLNQEGGDITRDIYSLAKNSKMKSKLRKNKSFDDLSSLHSTSRRGSTASALNVPGGFRRHHIVQKISETGTHANGNTPTESHSSATDSVHTFGEDGSPLPQPIESVPFLTRNFLEFLYVYGHFAGESFEDEFYPEDMKNGVVDGENTPLLMKHKRSIEKMSAKGTTSTFKAFLLMIKSFIGTGVLFLPKAFSNGGLFFCVFMLTFFGIYSFWCYYILIQSKVATKVSSFGDIGQKLYGPWMKVIILFSLVVTQLGFSAAYVVFTSTNLMAFVKNVFHLHEHLKIEWFLIFQIIVFIPLSFIRNVSKLSLPSLFANFFTMGGLLIVIFFVIKHLVIDLDMKPAEGIIYTFNPNSWSLFIGTAIFAFEGIGLIIPVQDSMKHPEHFPKVLLLVILTACVLFILVATLGYLAYGSSIDTVILLNLPQSNIFVNMIQFFYSMAILLSTPLQLFPAIAIIESKILKPRFVNHKLVTGKTDWKIKWVKNFIRSLIVIFTVGLAYFGSSNLDRFVSFVGCFACIPLVYMYPPMLHLLSCSKPKVAEKPTLKNKLLVTLDYGLLIFGGCSMLYTSYQCIFSPA
ncbi:Vacuolar amino acid transporter 4 [Hanseniaspora osmophila]|uniref:Vacuolar amino acid transporter 4 n=1 Tax=Hanseniaspora osmophila TaxID=56408 RepID=A0A1E5RNC3_9ASCO|nr:Vacuolar amino acid transporter 4 [Hanseniaspora osmophila]